MAIDAETNRLMQNWALWRSGSLTGVPSSGAYELEGRGSRAELPMPLINGDAVEIDQAVGQLDAPLKLAVEEYWLRAGSIEEKARRCGCEARTLYRRLDRAHAGIHANRRAKREASERQRKARSHSHCTNRIPERQ